MSDHEAAKPGHIVLDFPILGIGVAALQITVQGSDIEEAKYIHDQFVPLSPIMVRIMSFKLCDKGPQSQQDVLETILHVDHNAMIPEKIIKRV